MVYECSCINLPDYLLNNNDKQGQTDNFFQRQTRNSSLSDRLKFKCRVIPRVDAFTDSYFYRTHKKWNELPFEIRDIESIDQFKTRLKQYLWIIAEETYNYN